MHFVFVSSHDMQLEEQYGKIIFNQVKFLKNNYNKFK